jgi:NAD(P)-dependent dehydrogenase (short-subunit alcohol dehydrogenase family)
MSIEFKGRVAIVTGAGGGPGQAARPGAGAPGRQKWWSTISVARSMAPAARSAPHRRWWTKSGRLAGEAIANGASVTDFAAVQGMVRQAMDTWGRVDILVNNAGILRDKSFAKMEIADFRLVMDVHVMGAVHCSKAVWPIMIAQKYGRIVMTTSSSGLYGNFGQANYGAAKMGPWSA